MARMILVTVVAVLFFLRGALEPAEAGTSTGTLAVSVTVVSACTLGSAQLDFGTYKAGQTTNLDAQGTVDYSNCNGSLTFEMDRGNSAAISMPDRCNLGRTELVMNCIETQHEPSRLASAHRQGCFH